MSVIGRQHYMLRSRRLEQPWKIQRNTGYHKIDYDFEEHEIMDILPYDKYYRNMEKFHGADQYK